MTDEANAGTVVLDKAETGADVGADKNVDTGVDAGDKGGAGKAADAGADKGAGDGKSALGGADKAADKADTGDKGKAKDETASAIPENWRELAANGDENALKLLKRYGSFNGIVKSLMEKEALIRSGKVKRDMPDPKDEKALAEWRKAEGIPDDPTGYSLPDAVKTRMVDEDKPMLSSFTEYAHKKGAPQAYVDMATEWYFDSMEAISGKQLEDDAAASEAAEEALRKDWPGGEYKANLSLAKRYVSGIPGVGESWSEARLPDGRRLGDVPEFVSWASDQGRNTYGDAVFASGDTERQHNSRKAEIEKIGIGSDEYFEKGLDKEYNSIIEKELKRKS